MEGKENTSLSRLNINGVHLLIMNAMNINFSHKLFALKKCCVAAYRTDICITGR